MKTVTNLVQLLERAVGQFPGKEAVYDGSSRLSYSELDKESTAIAASLREIGIAKGDHIAVALPNWNEFVVIIFAVAKLGAVAVPFNPKYQEGEIDYIINNAKAKAAFLAGEVEGNDLLHSFEKVHAKSPYLEHLITVRADLGGAFNYEQMKLQQASDFQKAAPEVDDVAIILYTSGTTGDPKGTMLTHSNMITTGTVTSEVMNCNSEDVFLIPVPLCHIFGMVPGIISAVAVGAKMVLTQKFKAERTLQIVEQERVTVHHAVPSMFILELNHPNLKQYDLTSLRTGIVAAAPVPSTVISDIRKEMHCDILCSYGMTEASPVVSICTFADDDVTRAETVGRAFPGTEVEIRDIESQVPSPIGEVGEITARGPGIMKGYFEMPGKTKEVLSSDGWYRTGDLGTLDGAGYVRIVGRKKDLIIRGGFNIYPREVEEHFYQLDDLLEIAIVGLPDTVLGEVTCAAVILKEDSKRTEADLLAFIREKVAEYKVPDMVAFVSQLPMTASGKINKKQLQEKLEKELAHQLR